MSLMSYDTNRDSASMVDISEVEERIGPDHSGLFQREQNFDDYNLDHNGKLDAIELQPWPEPSLREASVEEAKHLMESTDLNQDGQVNEEEILSQQDTWISSSAMYYKHFETHDPSEL